MVSFSKIVAVGFIRYFYGVQQLAVALFFWAINRTATFSYQLGMI
ncbi:MAG: hypothetical protein ACPL28_08850 [bacterium]